MRLGTDTYETKSGTEAVSGLYEVYEKMLDDLSSLSGDKDKFTYTKLIYNNEIADKIAAYKAALICTSEEKKRIITGIKEREKLMKKYSIAATTDIGVSRERQEDYIFFKELDEKNLFCVIADGTGSRPSIPQPASIICLEIGNFIQTMWKNKKKDFCLDPKFYMKLPC